MNYLFKIIFSDGTEYFGGNLNKTLWKEIPNDKKIKQIFYILQNKIVLHIENFEKYYHMVEVTQNIYGSKNTEKVYRYVYIFGQKGNVIKCYKINIEFKTIDVKEYDINNIFIKKLNPMFWKEGICG